MKENIEFLWNDANWIRKISNKENNVFSNNIIYEKLPNAGYVDINNVNHIASTEDEFNTNKETYNLNDIIWIIKLNNGNWDIVKKTDVDKFQSMRFSKISQMIPTIFDATKPYAINDKVLVGTERVCFNCISPKAEDVDFSYENFEPFIMKENDIFYVDADIVMNYIPFYNYTLWQPLTSYTVNSVVLYEQDYYKCLEAHVSGQSFDNTKWQKNSGIIIPQSIIHNSELIFDNKTLVWSTYVFTGIINEWQPSTSYIIGDKVIYNNLYYTCITSHTSTLSFDASKWEEYNAIDYWKANNEYTIGDKVLYDLNEDNKYFICTYANTNPTFALTELELIDEWQPYTEYAIGKKIKYNNISYTCLISHTSGESFLITDPIPDLYEEEITYYTGDKVTYNSNYYVCKFNGVTGTFNSLYWDSINLNAYWGNYAYKTYWDSITPQEIEATDDYSSKFRLKTIKNKQVDLDNINNVYLVNNTTNETMLEMQKFDPLQMIFPNNVLEDIDFISYTNPANYNDVSEWAEKKVGTLWWDISKVRYLDYHQGSLEYRKKYWGKQIGDSEIAIYEWTESTIMPTDKEYLIKIKYNLETLTDEIFYYYWVKNPISINNNILRTKSAFVISKIINNPTSEGISWFAPIYSIDDTLQYSSFLITNFSSSTLGTDFVVQINFKNENNVLGHTEWYLLENNAEKDVPSYLWQKTKDSLLGEDKLGNIVPDTSLSKNLQTGIAIRPRQSMFEDLYEARRNFVNILNLIFNTRDIEYDTDVDKSDFNAIFEDKDVSYIGNYYISVNNHYHLEKLNDIDLIGKNVLVLSDEKYDGIWTLWTITNIINNVVSAELINYEKYDMTEYWKYVDLYSTLFHDNISPKYTVDTLSEVLSYPIITGDLVKVNSVNGWIIYEYVEGETFKIIARQNATINILDKLYTYMKNENLIEDNKNMVIYIDGITKLEYLNRQVRIVMKKIFAYFES